MNLVDRVKNILLTPKTEWPVIAAEPGDMAYLFKNYVAILAAIPAVCGFIGTSVVGVSVGGLGVVRTSIFIGLFSAILSYVLSFVAAYVVALIADALAPTFGGQKNFNNALKLTVYAYTPAWLVGIFSLIPALGFLGILGLYSAYLFWLGAPVLGKAAPDRATGYTAAVIICAIVIMIIFSLIIAALIFPAAR